MERGRGPIAADGDYCVTIAGKAFSQNPGFPIDKRQKIWYILTKSTKIFFLDCSFALLKRLRMGASKIVVKINWGGMEK